jgi:molecular chaperone Hsp33
VKSKIIKKANVSQKSQGKKAMSEIYKSDHPSEKELAKTSEQVQILRGVAFKDQFKFVVGVTTKVAKQIVENHQPSIQGMKAFSRMSTALALLSTTLKHRQQIGIQINGDGVLGEIYGIINDEGQMRITMHHPQAGIEPLDDLGTAIGDGRFTLIHALNDRDPYRGTVPLFTSTIAEDLAFYYAHSEQIPTVCGMGEILDINGIVACGGYFIQALPNAEESLLGLLEERVLALKPLQEILKDESPEMTILEQLFGNDYRILGMADVSFNCPCERARFATSLISLGKAELSKLIDEDHEALLNCHFCNSNYHFNETELKALLLGTKF